MNGTVAHLAPMLSERGISGRDAALATSFFGAATIVGRLGNDYLVDRLPAHRVAAMMFFGATLGLPMLLSGWLSRLVFHCGRTDRPGYRSGIGRDAVSRQPLFRDALDGDLVRMYLRVVHDRSRGGRVLFGCGVRRDQLLPHTPRIRHRSDALRRIGNARAQDLQKSMILRSR